MELGKIKISATVAVISRDMKALILQRLPDGNFPNLWTVAGGKMQDTDGVPHSKGFRYHSVESCARRELYEETGIFIGAMSYLCSATTTWGDTKRVILAFYVVLDKDAKDITITPDECQQYKWVTEDEISQYNFIPCINEELYEIFERIRGEKLHAA